MHIHMYVYACMYVHMTEYTYVCMYIHLHLYDVCVHVSPPPKSICDMTANKICILE